MCPGKKDWVKKGKVKKQRRILLDSLKNLHQRFVKKTSIKLSFATFARARPFWVTQPKKSDRDTCACIKHCNMEHLIFALKSNNVIKESNVNSVISAVVCSPKNESCMMGRCRVCAKKILQFTYSSNFKIKFWKWKNVKEERVINKKKKVLSKTVKTKETMDVKKMIATFNKELTIFKRHVFCQYHQAKELKKKMESLKERELLIRVDFSENYVCKYSTEIQSVHFGASKRQICLNTGVFYAFEEGEVQARCFATVSDNIEHQAHAVWAHMTPILERAALQYPNTEQVHFFSDSPSSQYRNRTNMYLMKITVPKIMRNVKFMSWNFTAAGHGKGPMDGVGGALKRMADYHVSHGTDITSSAEFISTLQKSKVMLIEIKDEEVKHLKSEVSNMNIPEIKGIMNSYQVTCNEGLMYMNSFSCFSCPTDKACEHFMLDEIFKNTSATGVGKKKGPKKMASKENRLSESSPLDLLARQLDIESDSDSNDIVLPVRPKRFSSLVKYNSEVFSSSDDEWLPSPSEKTCQLPGQTSGQTSWSDEPLPGPSSNKSSTKVHAAVDDLELGSFVLVQFEVEKKNKKNTCHQYVGVTQSLIEDDELNVMFLKEIPGDKTCFCVDEKDVSSIFSWQIVAVLPTPTLMTRGDRLFYKFRCPIEVY